VFNNIYKNKKVLITGHTGFKGSWLTTWLLNLGAEVIGISKDIPTMPAMFEVLELEGKIQHYLIDIRNFDVLNKIIKQEKPDFIFHLAAQAIVSTSYLEPLETISSNVMGTTHILESLRLSNHQCTAIIITSDKAYDNVEQIWGYKENDAMGGRDIYSGSKGAAELIIKSYYHSFFKLDKSNVRLSIARAGNVIGGGDWAKDRIIVDAMIAWSKGNKVEIRSPKATRPWQHVLEPLSGYLSLGQQLYADISLNGEGFNFGPRAEQNRTVQELLVDSSKYWNFDHDDDAFTITDNISFHEAGLLKLNCDKALSHLKWQANLEYKDTIKFTSEWYYDYYQKDLMFNKTLSQINEYENSAKAKSLKWTV
jgi:CDP-glucose 4,6-dehydratase